MTAVKGIEMLPLREDSIDSSLEVKSKSEPSPFDRLLSKGNGQDGEPVRQLKPEKSDAPVRPRVYSAKKIAALMKTGKEEGLVGEGRMPDFSVLGKSAASASDRAGSALSKLQKIKTAYAQASDGGQGENVNELVSRFLKGEISPEELDALVMADRGGSESKLRLFPLSGEAREGVVVADSEDEAPEGEDILRGFLTDDGKLLYFEEAVPGKDMKLSRQERNSDTAKVAGPGKSKVQVEINVTDLRTAQAQPEREAAANIREKQMHLVSSAKDRDSSDGDGLDDLLAGPSDKLIGGEGAGTKLQAPVSREVSRLFRDYMNETGNKELVRKIDFILKNDNQGEIKLILKPEALGNVRINLSLNENHIAGKIFVDNSSVRDIFLNNMDNLTNLLKANGYEGASLEVFVGQNGSGNNPSGGEREEEKNLRLLKGLEKLEESVPHTAQSDGLAEGQVNLVI